MKIAPLQVAAKEVFPWFPGAHEGVRGALPWTPFMALALGAALGALHLWLPRRFGVLPPDLEALVLLLAYAALGGLAPLRALARAGSKEAASAALIVVLGVLVLREALSVVVGLRTDISFPGARLVAAWPVVGRWGALLSAQLAPAVEKTEAGQGPGFLLASAALLVLFFAALSPGFFLIAAPALVVGAAGAQLLGRVNRLERERQAAAAAGIAEIVFVIGAAMAALRY